LYIAVHQANLLILSADSVPTVALLPVPIPTQEPRNGCSVRSVKHGYVASVLKCLYLLIENRL